MRPERERRPAPRAANISAAATRRDSSTVLEGSDTRRRRRLRVVIESRHCAFVSGYGSRELITEIRNGRPPMWNATLRAWVTTEETAASVIALAERRGYEVDVESYVVVRPTPTANPTTEVADTGWGLW